MVQPLPTSEVGRKFGADGSALYFPGNSIICPFTPEMPIYQIAQQLQAQLTRQVYGPKFVWMPPASFHMTIMDLVCHVIRSPEKWSKALPLDLPLGDVDRYMIDRLARVPTPANFSMRLQGLAFRRGVAIDLVPADLSTRAALLAYRDAVAVATGVRFPNHLGYGFHITLAYQLFELASAEKTLIHEELARLTGEWSSRVGEIDTGRPILTFFDDMFRFVPADQLDQLRPRP